MTNHTDSPPPSGRTRDRASADDGDLTQEFWGDDPEWTAEPIRPAAEPRRRLRPPPGGLDPLLARVGGLAVVLTLLVPVVLGFTGDGDASLRTAEAGGTLTAAQDVALGASAVAATAPPATPAAPTPTATAPAVVAEPEACALEYELVEGDFWIRIAEGSGATLDDLLAANSATVDTPLFPGRTICLPAGAAIPAPPVATTAAPAEPTQALTAAAVASAPANRTSPPVTTPSTTPATTAPPRPAPAPAPPPPPGSTATPEQVQAIIRAVWPDELEDKAIEIARRESTFRPTARNSCCYGIFQIYWSVHQGWLAGLGITSAEQLYDPTLNARAALALYQRAGGWGPWGG
jgi:hypothetical protein